MLAYTRRVILLAAVLVAAIAAPGPADDAGPSPEIEALRELGTSASLDPAMREKVRALRGLEEEDERMTAAGEMSDEERRQVVREKRRGHRARLRATPSHRPRRRATPSFEGIFARDEVPAPFRSSEFRVTNFWGGTVDRTRVGVYAGYRPEDPSRGVLVVFDDPSDVEGRSYEMPSGAGPAVILSEGDGELGVGSVAGEFEVLEQRSDGTSPPRIVRTSGLARYRFDLRERVYR